jgi:hypothetical protein
MKLFFTFLYIILNSALGLTQDAEFFLKERTFKFPKTDEGIILQHTFNFKNNGKSPLIINDFSVACHCTKVILPKEPILPGEEGEITFTFDTEGKYYHQDRQIILYTNSKKKIQKLRFKVFVIPKEEKKI